MRGFSLRSSILTQSFCVAAIALAAAAGEIFSASPASSGAFNQTAGSGQAILTASAMQGDFTFGSTGKLNKAPRYRKNELSIYADYGVTDWLMAFVKPGAENVAIGPPVRKQISGLGDSEIGAQLQVYKSDAAVAALRATLVIPGHPGSRNAAAIGHTSAAGQFDLVSGYVFDLGSWPSFVEASTGLRLRSGPQPSEWRNDTTFGTRPLPQLLLLAKTFSIVTVSAPRPPFTRASSLKAQASLVYDIDAVWSVEAGAFTSILGRNVLRERGLIAAVWRKF